MSWRSDASLDVEVRRRAARGETPDADSVRSLAGASVQSVSVEGARALASTIADDCVGLGPLAGLATEPGVTDVLLNADGVAWVDRGDGLVECGLVLEPGDPVRRLAVRLAAAAGRRLDDSQPWVDGQLPGGIRLHAVLPPVAADGTHISLRIPATTAWTLDRLVAHGTVDAANADLLARLVRAGRTILVSGATGAGKTSLLAALLAAVPDRERIVVVEDVRELRIDRPHVVSLQGRSANVEGVGAVAMRDLIRQALRMRADRLVVGEARGAEIVDLLAALNTGHAGLGTIHANSVAAVPERCAALGGLAGLPPETVLRQLRTAVDVVVQVARRPGRRVVAEVGTLEGTEINRALVRDGDRLRPAPGFARLEALATGTGLLP